MNQVDRLCPHMLSNKKIIKILNNIFYNSNTKNTQESNKKQTKVNKYFVPMFEDTLFWCFYIFYKGREMYENSSNSGFKEEKDFKFSFVDSLKQNPEFTKQHKIKYFDVENECVNMKKIGFTTLRALCLYYKINIIVVKDKLYYKFGDFFNDNKEVIYLENGKFGLNENITKDKIDFIEKNYIELQVNKKPLKAISGYSATELKIMNQKLGISIYNDNQKVKVKKELYDQLIKYII